MVTVVVTLGAGVLETGDADTVDSGALDAAGDVSGVAVTTTAGTAGVVGGDDAGDSANGDPCIG